MTQQLTDVVRSRFKLLDRPYAHPGKCAVCGAVNRPVVDFDLELDEYGAVYFCVTCLTQVAIDNLDLVQGEVLRSTRSTVEELNNKLNISAKVTDDYIENISNLHRDYVRVLNRVPSLSDTESDSGSESIHGERTEDERREIRDSVGTESTPDGSIGSEGSTSIPTNSGDGSSVFSFGAN